MVSIRAIFASTALLAAVLAQTSNVAFTSVPAELESGESFNITWDGGDGSPVTLTLRRGNPQDLSTVSVIADRVTEGYYVWSVPSDLEDGDDYALQITQGQSSINYSDLFSIDGEGEDSPNTTTTASSNSTMSITGAPSASGTGTTMQRNSTFSTATLTSSASDYTFDSVTSSTTRASRTSAQSTESTSVPSNDGPIKTGSSAALILGIIAAVMLH